MENDKLKFKSDFKRRLYNFILHSVKFVDSLPLGDDRSSSIIAQQVLKSITSIGANYIEAQSASSRRDFINFFNHSLKSANESKFWLAILRDTGKANKTEAEKLLNELKEISNIIASSILTLKGKR